MQSGVSLRGDFPRLWWVSWRARAPPPAWTSKAKAAAVAPVRRTAVEGLAT